MSAKHIYAPATAVVIECDTKTNLTGNTGLWLTIIRPDGVTVLSRAATQDSIDPNKMLYTIQAGDFDPNNATTLGNHLLIAEASFANAVAVPSDPTALQVLKKGQSPQ